MMIKKSIKTIYIYLFFILFISIEIFAAPPILIIDEGETNALIVTAPDASNEITFAAKILQKYLKKMSGVRVQIRKRNTPPKKSLSTIFVGPNAYLERMNIYPPETVEDAFIVKSFNNRMIALTGNNDRGTTYSIFHFLEGLGARWFMPGSIGEVIPKRKTIQVSSKMDEVQIPDYTVRHYKGAGSLPVLSAKDENSFRLWMLKNRWNRGYPADFSHYNTARGLVGHAYKEIVPQELFPSKPHYFSLINGKRSNRGQRCVSNPGVLKKAKAYVDRYFKDNPDKKMISLSPNDNNRHCQCKWCVEMDGYPNFIQGTTKRLDVYSGRVFRFANRVSEYMLQKHPGKYAAVYAYAFYSTFPPPMDGMPHFKLNKNVTVLMCRNLNSCDNHAINDPDCPINGWFRKNIAEPWSDETNNLWLYHYTYRWKAIELPWPMYHVAAENIRYFHGKGVWGFYASAGKQNWGSNGLYYYIISKLLWNTQMDVDELINDYCQKFYQSASEEMKAYYSFMETTITQSDFHFKNRGGIIDYIVQAPNVYTKELFTEGAAYLNRALKSTKNRRVKERIRIVQFSHLYAEKLIDFITLYALSQKTSTERDIQDAIDAGEAALDFIQEAYRPWSITLKTSTSAGAENFIRQTVNYLKKQRM